MTERNGKRNVARQSRRDFLKTTAVSAGALMLAGAHLPSAHAAGSDVMKVGVIGCGGRGTGAALDCLKAGGQGVQLWAMGDLFKDRLASSHAKISSKGYGDNKAQFDVPADRQFTGWDNHEKVVASGVDMVILATPPGFRPMTLKAAVDAGKHVFMEKPVAVDPTGIRSVIESAEAAEKKGLAIVAGTQRRHEPTYVETIKRIQNGMIGDLVSAQCYWNQGTLWVHNRKSEYSDMEWQIRNWLFLTWLSGDHIVEQHVHNLDILNWAMGSPPKQCSGMGGRQVRVEPQYGNIFDHFAVEYEYPNGARVMSMCRQTAGCHNNVSERVIGTRGFSYTDGANGYIKGAKAYEYPDKSTDPYVQEHTDLIAGIRAGKPINEGVRVAESTLTAIMGRISAYTGRALSWNWVMNSSKLDLSPPKYEFGDLPLAPVAVPGDTELV